MLRYKWSIYGGGFALFLYFACLIFDIDLFEALVELVSQFESYEVDEFIIPLMVFVVFALIDAVRINQANSIELEKVKIYKAMLSSTHHILNNFLNQMQYFKLTALETKEFPPKVLKLYDECINEAVLQIDKLGSIENIDEESIKKSTAP